ncbi:MAG: hypothetical protein GY906_17670 [bacterium]|nr:hypothetical protein [bacterium]
MNETRPQPDIDRPSFMLGMINCFVEMVACGVKQLALSPPMSPEDYKLLADASAQIAERSGVRWHLEESLIVTDLQTPDFTKNKCTVLYFKQPETLEEYLGLKQRKSELEAEGRYGTDERRQISREFMRLLGYPEDVVEEKLALAGSQDPYIHDIGGGE